MTQWPNGFVPTLHRSYLLLAYLILVASVVVSFMYMAAITERIERESLQRAYENCEVTNRNMALTLDILQVTDPGLVNLFEKRLQPIECPPNPDETVLTDTDDANIDSQDSE